LRSAVQFLRVYYTVYYSFLYGCTTYGLVPAHGSPHRATCATTICGTGSHFTVLTFISCFTVPFSHWRVHTRTPHLYHHTIHYHAGSLLAHFLPGLPLVPRTARFCSVPAYHFFPLPGRPTHCAFLVAFYRHHVATVYAHHCVAHHTDITFTYCFCRFTPLHSLPAFHVFYLPDCARLHTYCRFPLPTLPPAALLRLRAAPHWFAALPPTLPALLPLHRLYATLGYADLHFGWSLDVSLPTPLPGYFRYLHVCHFVRSFLRCPPLPLVCHCASPLRARCHRFAHYWTAIYAIHTRHILPGPTTFHLPRLRGYHLAPLRRTLRFCFPRSAFYAHTHHMPRWTFSLLVASAYMDTPRTLQFTVLSLPFLWFLPAVVLDTARFHFGSHIVALRSLPFHAFAGHYALPRTFRFCLILGWFHVFGRLYTVHYFCGSHSFHHFKDTHYTFQFYGSGYTISSVLLPFVLNLPLRLFFVSPRSGWDFCLPTHCVTLLYAPVRVLPRHTPRYAPGSSATFFCIHAVGLAAFCGHARTGSVTFSPVHVVRIFTVSPADTAFLSFAISFSVVYAARTLLPAGYVLSWTPPSAAYIAHSFISRLRHWFTACDICGLDFVQFTACTAFLSHITWTFILFTLFLPRAPRCSVHGSACSYLRLPVYMGLDVCTTVHTYFCPHVHLPATAHLHWVATLHVLFWLPPHWFGPRLLYRLVCWVWTPVAAHLSV